MKRLLLLSVCAALVAAGCGDDDEDTQAPATAPTVPSETAEAPPATETTDTEAPTETATSPEDEEGGAGDEEAIRSEAVFTCAGESVLPKRVEVPAFIAIKVRLEGSGCRLSIGGHELRPGDSHDLEGLPPQERYRGTSGGQSVQIVPTAEPGP